MFIISLSYVKPLDELDRLLPAHITFLEAQYAAGHFLASGRKVPRTGGIILSNIKSREDLEEIIRLDPFHIERAAEYEIIEFTPSMTSRELSFLKET